MSSRIIYQGKLPSGLEILVRYPEISDAKQYTDFINELSEERTFLEYQGEKITLDEETKYLEDVIKKIEQKNEMALSVFSNNLLIADSGISMSDKTTRHIGTFGISIAKNFRGKGLGKFLIDLIEKEAVKNLPELEIIILGVFANNEIAINLYKQFGFQEEGKLPNGVKLENGYVDHIFMYKVVK